MYFFGLLNRTVVLRAKFRPKIGKIRQNRIGWQVWQLIHRATRWFPKLHTQIAASCQIHEKTWLTLQLSSSFFKNSVERRAIFSHLLLWDPFYFGPRHFLVQPSEIERPNMLKIRSALLQNKHEWMNLPNQSSQLKNIHWNRHMISIQF
jgi:hypothetical protein